MSEQTSGAARPSCLDRRRGPHRLRPTDDRPDMSQCWVCGKRVMTPATVDPRPAPSDVVDEMARRMTPPKPAGNPAPFVYAEADSGRRMKTARPCPIDPDGGHLMIDQGRNESLASHVYRCVCGIERLGNTDEAAARCPSEARATP